MSALPDENRRPGVRTDTTTAGSEVSADDTSNASALAYVAQVSREIGFESAMSVMLAAGREMSREAARAIWVHPRFAEIAARRVVDHQPCPTKCGRCSRCIHSRAWWARGGRPFEGTAAEARRVGA